MTHDFANKFTINALYDFLVGSFDEEEDVPGYEDIRKFLAKYYTPIFGIGEELTEWEILQGYVIRDTCISFYFTPGQNTMLERAWVVYADPGRYPELAIYNQGERAV